MNKMISLESLQAAATPVNPAALMDGPHKLKIRSAFMGEGTTSNGTDYQYLLLNVTDSAGNDHNALKINAGLTKLELAKFASLWQATMGDKPLKGVAGSSGLPSGKIECLKGKSIIAQMVRKQEEQPTTYTDEKGFKNDFAPNSAKKPTFAKVAN